MLRLGVWRWEQFAKNIMCCISQVNTGLQYKYHAISWFPLGNVLMFSVICRLTRVSDQNSVQLASILVSTCKFPCNGQVYTCRCENFVAMRKFTRVNEQNSVQLGR
jgi:hypothetical protein